MLVLRDAMCADVCNAVMRGRPQWADNVHCLHPCRLSRQIRARASGDANPNSDDVWILQRMDSKTGNAWIQARPFSLHLTASSASLPTLTAPSSCRAWADEEQQEPTAAGGAGSYKQGHCGRKQCMCRKTEARIVTL
eukprot:1148097-Pelagomonas_calceolata.AAC.4